MDPTAQTWLELQCRFINETKAGLVMLGEPGKKNYELMARWPSNKKAPEKLLQATELCLNQNARKVVKRKSKSSELTVVTCPLVVGGQCFGAITLLIQGVAPMLLQHVENILSWGCDWFSWLAKERKVAIEHNDQLKGFVELMAMALKHDNLEYTALVIADSLCDRLACSRVSIGIVEHHYVHVIAVSGYSNSDDAMSYHKPIRAAMEEASDQHATISVDSSEDQGNGLVTHSHRQLIKDHDLRSACSIPMIQNGHVTGVLTIENSHGGKLSGDELKFCEQIGLLLGPVLTLKKSNNRYASLGQRVKHFIEQHVIAYRAILTIVLALIMVPFIVTGNFEVNANAVLESESKQVILAAQDGYIAEAPVRAGDKVETGQTLITMDDRDLRLELQRWKAKHAQFMKSYNNALSKHDKGEIHILRAQVEQANAQIELLDYQLSRTLLTAPFSGVIVSGDYSQSLGAPIKKGDVLYELGLLDRYRLLLKVDERDIVNIKEGQQGHLVLSSLPDERVQLAVERISPVMTTESGSDYFYVEAKLLNDELQELLRPGMTGVAKVSIDERKLIWIWFHRLIDTIQLWLWRL